MRTLLLYTCATGTHPFAEPGGEGSFGSTSSRSTGGTEPGAPSVSSLLLRVDLSTVVARAHAVFGAAFAAGAFGM